MLSKLIPQNLEAEFQKKTADAVAEAMKKAEEKAKTTEKEKEEAARLEKEEALKERNPRSRNRKGSFLQAIFFGSRN